MPKRILIVEDDAAISRLLESNLRLSGYQLICTADGWQALELLQNQPFDLALCDIMLPEIDGFELLPHMRAQGVPVIFVSAKADVQSRVRGLRLGAEDYLVKPFDILELLVRMEKVLARSDKHPQRFRYRDIAVDEASHTVTKSGTPVSLKPMECELLLTFIRHPAW